MDVEIRTAASDDQGAIAELIYSSGKDLYDYLYGGQALEFIDYEFRRNQGFTGCGNVSVIVKHSDVVATGCFYDGQQFIERAKGSYQNVLAFFGEASAQAVLARLKHTSSVVKAPKEGELYLSNFGVSPQLRGQGLGSMLIEHTLQAARKDGYTLFGLDVSALNPSAQSLYERIGLNVVEEKNFSDLNAGVAASRKMEMQL